MHSRIATVAFRGIETIDVEVQVHITNGLPSMAIVGLADKSVAESKERVRAALSSLGLALPSKRIAINLSPADVLKEGAHFDLPIAVALLVAMGVMPEDSVIDCLILGYLGAKPAEGIYIVLARVATVYYFAHFLVILPILGLVEKTKEVPESISAPIRPTAPQAAE